VGLISNYHVSFKSTSILDYDCLVAEDEGVEILGRDVSDVY